jgi:hypothetical protein
VSPEEYYHWERSFKAHPVPHTTYHPQKLELMNERELKAQAVLNLKKAQYPSTMQYLCNYN